MLETFEMKYQQGSAELNIKYDIIGIFMRKTKEGLKAEDVYEESLIHQFLVHHSDQAVIRSELKAQHFFLFQAHFHV